MGFAECVARVVTTARHAFAIRHVPGLNRRLSSICPVSTIRDPHRRSVTSPVFSVAPRADAAVSVRAARPKLTPNFSALLGCDVVAPCAPEILAILATTREAVKAARAFPTSNSGVSREPQSPVFLIFWRFAFWRFKSGSRPEPGNTPGVGCDAGSRSPTLDALTRVYRGSRLRFGLGRSGVLGILRLARGRGCVWSGARRRSGSFWL